MDLILVLKMQIRAAREDIIQIKVEKEKILIKVAKLNTRKQQLQMKSSKKQTDQLIDQVNISSHQWRMNLLRPVIEAEMVI
jgi:hypothetical protein